MKKVLKSRLFVAIITAIICITGTAYAAGQIFASDIKYIDKDNNETTVDRALDVLYTKASSNSCVSGSFICDDECITTGKRITDFKPSSVVFLNVVDIDKFDLHYYNENFDSLHEYYSSTSWNIQAKYEDISYIVNDGLIIKNSSSWLNKMVYYMACR